MRKLLAILLSSLLLLLPFSGCKNNDGTKTIRLNEVTHSVFYAPLYLAIEKGYFDEQNIKIELTNGGGADSSMTAVLSGSAEIGLMGPETVIYVYNQGKKDAPKVFGQLTQKDGSFLVSRYAEPDFQWTNLQGKEILAGRKGGVPAMTFEYVLNELNMKYVALQLSAYKDALASQGITVQNMYVLWLKKDGTYEYIEVPNKNNIFMYSLLLYNFWKGEL
jgi:NitT/TauT family transport system substrate-binding protein